MIYSADAALLITCSINKIYRNSYGILYLAYKVPLLIV